MATIIKTDGTTQEIEKPSLERLQEIVGGYIEALRLKGGMFLVVNEEGLIRRLPVNRKASVIYGRGTIVGDAVICTRKELN